MFNVTEDIKYIGVDDADLGLFEGQYSVPDGVSYNSYVCIDKKTAVFDTVDDRKTEEWLDNLEKTLNGESPDYLIISHVEPDHSSSIPAFLKKYPAATVVGNDKTFLLIERFYGGIVQKKLVVKENDGLSLGRHKITFLFAPMVHWPEVMTSYDSTDGVLFSADAFGKFGTLAHNGPWLDEARRYYINIVGKYGNPVQGILKKVSGLKIKTICPLHGPVLDDNLSYYINKYNLWSTYQPEEEGVMIAYASVYGHTAAAALKLAELLRQRGVKAEAYDLTRCDISAAVATAFKYSKLVVASITYESAIMPCAETFINKLKAKNFSNRKIGLIENGSWAPVAGKFMRTLFESFKGISLCNATVTLNSSLDEGAEENLIRLADELMQ